MRGPPKAMINIRAQKVPPPPMHSEVVHCPVVPRTPQGVKGGGRGIAVDASGAVFVVGVFSGQAAFGTTTLSSSGGVFVAKLDNKGSFQWAADIGGWDYNSLTGYGIALEREGAS